MCAQRQILWKVFDCSSGEPGVRGSLDIFHKWDPRTKTGWSRTERFGRGPRTGSDQGQQNFENFKQIRTWRSVHPCFTLWSCHNPLWSLKPFLKSFSSLSIDSLCIKLFSDDDWSVWKCVGEQLHNINSIPSFEQSSKVRTRDLFFGNFSPCEW